MYFPFVTLTLPTLAARVRKHVTLQIKVDDKEETEKMITKEDDKKECDKTLEKSKEDDNKKGEESHEKSKNDNENYANQSIEKSIEADNVTAKKDLVKEKVQKTKKEQGKVNMVVKETVTSNEKEDMKDNKPEETLNNDVKEPENLERVPERVIDTIDRLQRALIDKCSEMDMKLTSSLEMQTEMKINVAYLTDEVKALKEKAESSKEELKSEMREIKVTVDTFNSEWNKKFDSVLETAKNVKSRIDNLREDIKKT